MDDEKLQEEEATEPTWEDYVRTEVNALLDIYLPFSGTGNVGIKYKHPVDHHLEDGTEVLKDDVCTGVVINLVFDFDQEMKVLGDNNDREE